MYLDMNSMKSDNNHTGLLREKAYHTIKRAIVTGEYESNSILYESKMAMTLGMSRTPVREALMRLAEEGLVKNLPNNGFLVTAVTLREIDEIFDLRLCLEKYVIEEVIDNDILIDLTELVNFVKEQETALEKKDYWANFEANHQFHTKLVGLSQNETLTKVMQGLRDKPIQSGFRALRRDANLSEAIVEHKAIIDALRNRDKAHAITEVKLHVLNAKKRALGIIP